MKGRLNTAYMAYENKKKNKKRKQKPTGGDRGNVLIQTQSGTFTVLSIQHMGGEERAPMFVLFFFMFRSGANAWRKYIH